MNQRVTSEDRVPSSLGSRDVFLRGSAGDCGDVIFGGGVEALGISRHARSRCSGELVKGQLEVLVIALVSNLIAEEERMESYRIK